MGLHPVPMDQNGLTISRPPRTPTRVGVPSKSAAIPSFVEVIADHDFPVYVILTWNGNFVEHVSGRVRPDVARIELSLDTPGVRIADTKGPNGEDMLDFSEWARKRWALGQVRLDDLIRSDGLRVGVFSAATESHALSLLDWCDEHVCDVAVLAQVAARSFDLLPDFPTYESAGFRLLRRASVGDLEASDIEKAAEAIRENKGKWRETVRAAMTYKLAVPETTAAPEISDTDLLAMLTARGFALAPTEAAPVVATDTETKTETVGETKEPEAAPAPPAPVATTTTRTRRT